MGKNKNKSANSAAEQAVAQQAAPGNKTDESKSTKKVNVLQLGDLSIVEQMHKNGNLDHNRIMDMIRVQHETFRMDPKAAEHTGMSEEVISKINMINAVEQVALMASVVNYDKTPFAIAMRAAQLSEITEAAALLGVNIDLKALPAPNEEGVVEVPSTAIKPSKEAKAAIEEEHKAATKNVITDPTKIENEEQLKDSILSILVKGNGSDNFYDKVSTAVNFYESYLGIKASKAENSEEELATLKAKSKCELLTEIAHMLGKCTFTIGGMAKFLFDKTKETKSPVVAFCTFRNASLNKKTGMPQIDDQLVADIVRVLVRWYADTEIATSNEVIAGFERDIEILKKDAKKNAKGIEDGEKKIKNAKNYIDGIEKVVGYCNAPSRSVVDEFANDYVDNTAEGFKKSRMIAAKVLTSYYPGLDVKTIKQDSLIHNVQQYIGVICNMFLPPMDQIVEYSEKNITEFEKIEESEKKEENADKSKNE